LTNPAQKNEFAKNHFERDESNEPKFTWNLEIRRLKEEDSALYYCVLNSENLYGKFYKLHVLRKFLNFLKQIKKSKFQFYF
jgi:hypothetical protein